MDIKDDIRMLKILDNAGISPLQIREDEWRKLQYVWDNSSETVKRWLMTFDISKMEFQKGSIFHTIKTRINNNYYN